MKEVFAVYKSDTVKSGAWTDFQLYANGQRDEANATLPKDGGVHCVAAGVQSDARRCALLLAPRAGYTHWRALRPF